MWLLLVEDEKRLAGLIRRGLEEEGYTVDVAFDGEEGEILALTNAYDALIVDWRLPRQDGRQLVERLREEGKNYPILMLTALGDIEHKVTGLDAGADDYLSKPFAFEELFARLRALIRRAPHLHRDYVLERGPLRMNTVRREATLGGTDLMLRAKEFALLALLAQNTGAVLSRTIIAERVWGTAWVTDNVIGVTVSGLRQKLQEAQAASDTRTTEAVAIETIRGIGYRLVAKQPS